MTIRIVFISPRPYGLIGTPGTYQFVEMVRQIFTVRVFALPPSKTSVHNLFTTPLIPLDTIPDSTNIESIIPVLHAFNPEIIYLFNQPRWPEVLQKLKGSMPNVKFVLDLKSPLLVSCDKVRYRIQTQGQAVHLMLDALVTHSMHSVNTWIPDCQLEPIETPPGIDASLFDLNRIRHSKNDITNFVYIASLAAKRKSHELISGFAKFLKTTGLPARLDIFGDGPDRVMLAAQIAEYGLEHAICLKGIVNHSDLMALLPSYDAGIAWVPKENYDDAPSLKAFEYMAASLPILATATNAHKRLLNEGFSLNLFADTPNAVAEALANISTNGFEPDRVMRNHELVQKYDYRNIVGNRILPLLRRLAGIDGDSPNRDNSVSQVGHLDSSKSDKETTVDNILTYRAHNHGLRLVFAYENLGIGSKQGEDIAVGVANEMARRGHCVYLAYDEKSGVQMCPAGGDVILLPLNGMDNLQPLLTNLSADVLGVFSSATKCLLNFSRLGHNCNIPLVIAQGFDPSSLHDHNSPWKRFGIPYRLWMWELVTSSATRIRVNMPNYADWLPDFIRFQTHVFPDAIEMTKSCTSSNEAEDKSQNIPAFAKTGMYENTEPHNHTPANLASALPNWLSKTFERIKCPVKAVFKSTDTSQRLKQSTHIVQHSNSQETQFVSEHIKVGAIGTEHCLKSTLQAFSAGDSTELKSKSFYDQWENLLQEAALYKNDSERLFREQCDYDRERAMHVKRMRSKLLGY